MTEREEQHIHVDPDGHEWAYPGKECTCTGGRHVHTDPEGREHVHSGGQYTCAEDGCHPGNSRRVEVMGFDIETASADRLYSGTLDGGPYVRLIGMTDGSRPTTSAYDPDAARQFHIEALERADHAYGHNVFRFDIPALARHAGMDFDALAAKSWDTAILERLVDPPGAKHDRPAGYYGLDETAHRYGHEGKTDDLEALALRHAGPEPGTRKEKTGRGFERIPVDDREYRDYLVGDLRATEFVQRKVFARVKDWDYARREMKVAAIQNRMSFNGWRVNRDVLAAKVRQEDERREAAVAVLCDDYGVPRTRADGGLSASPWATAAGRDALVAAFKEAGADYVPRTASGALAIGKEPMGHGKHGAEGWWVNSERKRVPTLPAYYADNKAVLALCDVITQATGATAKFAEIQRHVTDEGRVHSGIGEDQASGRWAMTNPSTSNLGKHGPGIQQRAPFVPERGHVLITCDSAQVDMRALAGLCQDAAYMALFAPGRDAHLDMAEVYFGVRTKEARHRTKGINHKINYGGSAKSTAVMNGLDLGLVQAALAERARAYPRLIGWTREVQERAARGDLLNNGFGRLMRCDPERAGTQAAALMGQGAARDLICEALLRLVAANPQVTSYLRGVVHDEVILSVPEREAEYWREAVRDAFTFTWRDVPILCDVGPAGQNWAECYAGE